MSESEFGLILATSLSWPVRMLGLLCMRPTASSVGKPRPAGLAFGPGSTRSGQKERALLNRREPPGIGAARPRLRRIGYHWLERAFSPATAIRATHHFHLLGRTASR